MPAHAETVCRYECSVRTGDSGVPEFCWCKELNLPLENHVQGNLDKILIIIKPAVR